MTDTFKTLEERKEEHIVSYVASLAAIEDAMEPFKEQKRALNTFTRKLPSPSVSASTICMSSSLRCSLPSAPSFMPTS